MRSARRPRPGPIALLRTLLAVGAIVPGLLAGLALLLLTRDRRRARNRTFEIWGTLGTRAAGIRLDVRGAEHLAKRPAVFVINHASGIDPLLVCALLKRDFVGVAKRELRRNPLLGPAFAFAGSVFLDRGDREQSVAALGPAVETLRSGDAIAIAPEGTRHAGALGPFKKGAFHVALAARASVVPIVICNAADVLPRGSRVMTPATVRVVVLPPVSTRDWTRDALAERVAEVRGLFVDVLDRGSEGPPRGAESRDGLGAAGGG